MPPEVLNYLCPFCGTDARVGKPCPGCVKKSKPPGKKSWQQSKSLDGLDLPSDDFDYEAFVAREFGGKAPHQALGIKWYWWLLAIALLGLMASGVILTG